MKLRLFTAPECPKCPAAKEIAENLAKQRGDVILEILDISNVNNLTTALMLQICSTPSFVIEETPIFIGEVPSITELNQRIDEYKNQFV